MWIKEKLNNNTESQSKVSKSHEAENTNWALYQYFISQCNGFNHIFLNLEIDWSNDDTFLIYLTRQNLIDYTN